MNGWIKRVCLFTVSAAALTLGACGAAKFDAAGYTKACLDAAYHGEYDKYAEFLDISEKEAKADMDKQSELAMEREMTGIPDITDAQKKEYLALSIEAQKLTKYTVGDAKETEDGYEVSVTIEPTDVYEQYVNKLPGKIEMAVSKGSYDESTFMPLLMDTLRESIDSASYEDKTETKVKVSRSSDGSWQITESEMQNLGKIMLPGIE